jgi:hypothetical protein
VRLTAESADDVHALAAAALLASRQGAIITGPTAAELWGLPLPRHLLHVSGRLIDVSVEPGTAHPARRGIRGRRFDIPPEHVDLHDGLAMTNVPRTWLECSAVLPIHDLVAMGDHALRTRLATAEQLSAITHWGFRRRGVASARRALPLLDPRAESPAESWTRVHLVSSGVPHPECNVDIYDRGMWVARVDMCWRQAKVIVEYDGAVHLQEEMRRRDAQRRNALQSAGWLVITFTADDLRRPWLMVSQVRQAIRDRT